jgi:hypothetical protein
MHNRDKLMDVAFNGIGSMPMATIDRMREEKVSCKIPLEAKTPFQLPCTRFYKDRLILARLEPGGPQRAGSWQAVYSM